MKESRELTLEELEHVIGGAGPLEFGAWRAKFLNHGEPDRKEQNVEEIYEKQQRTRND